MTEKRLGELASWGGDVFERRISLREVARLRTDLANLLLDVAVGRSLVRAKLGPRTIFVLNHPDLIERVLAVEHRRLRRGTPPQSRRFGGESLVMQEGDEHARRRKLVESIFSQGHIGRWAHVVVTSARAMEERWGDGAVVDLDAEMTQHMLDVVGRALFDADYPATAKAIRAAFDASRQVIHQNLLPLAIVLWSLPLPATRRYNSARARLGAAIDEMAARRRGPDAPADLLSALVNGDSDGEKLTEAQVRDEAWSYLAQGAPAHALTWTWWLLARHESAQSRVLGEIGEVIGDGLPTANDVARLPFTTAVVTEALRLYPPLWGIDRVTLEPLDFDGRVVPEGAIVFVSPWITHHDERFWPRPFEFEPDRWLTVTRPGAAYLPFGIGQRLCPAKDFVMVHCILTLAVLARRWQLWPVSDRVELEVFPFIRPKGGLPVRLARRPAA